MGGHRAEEDSSCKTVRHKKESWRSAGVVTIGIPTASDPPRIILDFRVMAGSSRADVCIVRPRLSMNAGPLQQRAMGLAEVLGNSVLQRTSA
jgi:hypothetical protein